MLESLYLHVPSSPEKKRKDDSPLFIARVPKSPVRNVVTPTISTCEETEKHDEQIIEKERPKIEATSVKNEETEKLDEQIVEKEKPKIEATSIMRPRAVLSSPYNDAVIGIKNRKKAERPTALRKAERPTVLRNYATIPNRHVNAQCKVSPTHNSSKSQINTTSPNDAPDNKSDLKGKKGPAMAVPSPRRKIRDWKF